MAARNQRNTKSRIVAAAWKLFYEKGYDDTTVEEIIAESGTSKGSFYHYFEGKDGLLGSLAYLFDEKYEELEADIREEENVFPVLLRLNHALFSMIENAVDPGLLTRLYSTQLTTRGEKQLLDHSRVYYRLLRRLVQRGLARGDLSGTDKPAEIVRLYALVERGLLYDWCLSGGEYSLTDYAASAMPLLLAGIRGKNEFAE